jgi:coenzyme F420-dependent glucose-6-phosphate dehydrogenase
VGPMVIPPIGIRHHPVDVAIEIATLELLYPGRVALGVGTGEAMNEKTTTGIWPPLRERIERLLEGVELIKRCWSEPDYFRHRGKHFQSFFYLYQKPTTEIPIICAAGGPKMARNAGLIADGYVSVGIPPDVHRTVMQPAFNGGRAESGRADESRFKTAWVSTSYHPDAERALDGARVYGGLLIPEAYAYIEDPRVIEQRALLVRDEAMRAAFCIASSGEEIIAQFERFMEAGCNHIIWADMSPDPSLVADVCRNEVLPFLKSKYGSEVGVSTAIR